MEWTLKRLAIEGAKKQYPYTLWFRYNSQDRPIWYVVWDAELEAGLLKNLSNLMQFTWRSGPHYKEDPWPW